MRYEESAPVRVVVVGGGVGGTLAANLIARRMRGRAAVELVTASPWHVYEPALINVPFPDADPIDVARPVRDLVDSEVTVIDDPAVRIAPADRRVELKSGLKLAYDYLILATGSQPDFSSVPGLADCGHSFATVEAAERLRDALFRFAGGKIVVGAAGLPHRHPAAPLELALLLADFLDRNGLAGRSEIRYVYPLDRIAQTDELDRIARERFDERGIRKELSLRTARVDPRRKVLIGADGREVPFDLLVLLPPDRGAQVIRDSGLGDERGLLPVDPETLRVEGTRDVFAMGPCSNLSIAKVPSAAHHQASCVVEQIVADFEGRPPRRRFATYDGQAELFVRVGDDEAVLIEGDYGRKPQVHGPSVAIEAARAAFDRAYWSVVPTGLIP